MQIWEDIDKEKYFLFDSKTGKNIKCDKFGIAVKSFTPYRSGFGNRDLQDFSETPGLTQKMTEAKSKTDLSKIESFGNKLKTSRSQKILPPVEGFRTITIEDLKKMKASPGNEVKTVRDLEVILETNKKNMKDFSKKNKKTERRLLKGFFTLNVPSSTDLFKREKDLMVITNPTRHTKQVKYEEMDKELFVKRRHQRILLNKLDLNN